MLTLKTLLGFGVEGDTYATLAAADDFHADRGNTDWAAASETAREQKLRLATDWLDSTYSWYSRTGYSDIGAPGIGYDTAMIPEALERATIMLAREALTVTLASTQLDRRVRRERVKVEGAVERETEYIDNLVSRFPWLDAMLSPYGSSASGGTGRISRA